MSLIKKTLSLVMALIMVATVFSANTAFATTYGDYEYSDNGDGTATVSYYFGTDTEVTIPSELNGLTVTTLADDSFSIYFEMFEVECGITDVIIPNGVTTLGDHVFYSCTKMKTITIPASVTTVGKEQLPESAKINYIRFLGTKEQWSAINFGEFNEKLTGSLIKCTDGSFNCKMHIWNDGVETTPPGCETEGVTTYTCKSCGETKTEPIVATGHDWNDGVITTEVTCESNGVKTFTCKKCGETKTETVVTEGHKWDDGVVTKEATCTENGSIVFTCSVCKGTREEVINKKGHKYQLEKMYPATCTEEGLIYGVRCTVCGDVLTKKGTIQPLGHDYSIVKIEKKATCKQNGIKSYTCSRCGDVKKESYSDPTHSYNSGKITKQPTCTEKGQKVYTCTVCGVTKKETLAAKGHKAVTDKAVAATYTSTGLTQGSHCSVCKKVLKAQQKVAKKKVPATSFKKLTAKSKSVKLTWKKVSVADGYQIQYATDSKIKKNKKTVTIKKGDKTSKTVKKLKGKKKYYFRIRAYKVVNGKKVYSSWSKVQSVKTKK